MPLFTAKCDDSVRIVGQPEVGQKRASGKRARSVPLSPRAVSEAPPERRVGMSRRCARALRIQRLEGSRPAGLWDLYQDEPVLIVCEFVVAVRVLGFR